MIACLSPNGQNLTSGNAAPTRLLVATLKGINVLERSGPAAACRPCELDGPHIPCCLNKPA